MKRSKYGVRTPESGVLRACLDLLAAEKIWHRRWNTGAVKAEGRFFRFGQKGDADILATPIITHMTDQGFYYKLLVLWCECKSDTGKQSEAQIEFQKSVEFAGHHYLLARSSDDLKNWLIEHGVIRK